MAAEIDTGRTADYWDRHAERIYENPAEWLAHPAVSARLAQLRDGKSVSQWLADRYLPQKPVRRALSIGCGVASFELELLKIGAVEVYDLYDLSPVALDIAHNHARAAGLADRVRVHCADIHDADLGVGRYDLVTFISSLHHIDALEAILVRLKRALQPGGVLFASEYIGPDRFAYPPAHAEYAKRLYRALDPALRCPWPELPQPDPEEVRAADPTESIHSSAIIATVQRTFDDVQLTPYGFTLTFILWWGLNHEALYATKQGREFVETLLDLDAALVRAGMLPNYFSYIVARVSPRRSLKICLPWRRHTRPRG